MAAKRWRTPSQVVVKRDELADKTIAAKTADLLIQKGTLVNTDYPPEMRAVIAKRGYASAKVP